LRNGDICIPTHDMLHSFRLEYLKIKNRKIKIFGERSSWSRESKPEQNTKPVQRLQSLRDLEESGERITKNLVQLTPELRTRLVVPLEAELNS